MSKRNLTRLQKVNRLMDYHQARWLRATRKEAEARKTNMKNFKSKAGKWLDRWFTLAKLRDKLNN